MFVAPLRAQVSYTDKLEHAPVFVHTSLPAQALFFGTLWFPYDRPLPEHDTGRTTFPCVVPGSVVRDWSVQEAPTYSCCDGLVCPLTPPPGTDILRAMLFERPVQVWWRGNASNATWQLLKDPFVYYDPVSVTSVLKRCVAVAVVLGIVVTVLTVVVQNVHKISARYPKCAMCAHVFVLTVVAAFSAQSLADFDAPLYRVAAAHLFLEAIASPLLVYTPAQDQHIGHRDKRCGAKLRRAAECMFTLRMCACMPVAVYGACDMAWVVLDAEFDLLISLALCTVVMSIMHIVAFVTGLHEIEAPLRLHDHSVVHSREHRVRVMTGVQVAVHGVGWMPADWKPPEYRVYALRQLQRALVLREIGKLNYGKVRRERMFMVTRAVAVYAANGLGDLEKLGTLRPGGHLHRDDHAAWVTRLLGLLLWVYPTAEDEGYNLNAVHSLRAESHRLQKKYCRPKCCGGAWWVSAMVVVGGSAVVLYVAFDPSTWFLWGLEIAGVCAALDFGVIATTKSVVPVRGSSTCPSRHTLVSRLTDDADGSDAAAADAWHCDVCRRTLAKKSAVGYCASCDWAICDICILLSQNS